MNRTPSELLIPIARRVRDGKLYGPDAPNLSGEALTCAECKSEVVLRTREGYRNHFVHIKEANCHATTESLIHLAAKDIIGELGFVWLPEINIFAPHSGEKLSEDAKKHTFIECEKEVPIYTAEDRKIKPDLILKDSRGNSLAIEITYKHPTGDEKKELFPVLNLPCIELDLSDVPETIPLTVLRQTIADFPQNYRWIYNRRIARLIREDQIQKRLVEARKEAERNERIKKLLADKARGVREEESKSKETRAKMHAEARSLPIKWMKRPMASNLTPMVFQCPKATKKIQGRTYANYSTDCKICDCFCGYDGDARTFASVRCGWWSLNPLPGWIKPQTPAASDNPPN